jgi:AmiR/NasT family two-component response regulator
MGPAQPVTYQQLRDVVEQARVVRDLGGATRQRAAQVCERSREILVECAESTRRLGRAAPQNGRRAATVAGFPAGGETSTTDADSLQAEIRGLERDVSNLRAALESRDVIWTAKVVIAATTGCAPNDAHRMLVEQSQHENRKLRDIAAEIAERAARS